MTPDAPGRVLERYGPEHRPISELRSLGGSGGLSGSRLWPRKSSAEKSKKDPLWLRSAAPPAVP